ncbi:MAG TPA: hypothetical protein EYP14_08625, partial [Planctomycetaceae bacterium]|nr:hypothetical protein [Planctomycetaceae bacterium]
MRPNLLCTGILGTVLLGGIGRTSGSTPVAKKVLRLASQPMRELARNPEFTRQRGHAFVGWNGYGKGYEVDGRTARTGRASARCRRRSGDKAAGLGQSIRITTRKLAPLVIGLWSKAEGVSGTPDTNYSLYVDLVYEDGTPLWGQAAPFSTGTHDWEYREVTIVPQKPIRQLTVYGLFRGHTGTVWFDDCSVKQLQVPKGAGLFDGALVAEPERPPQSRSPLEGIVLVRDTAAGSDFYSLGSPAAEGRTLRLPDLELEVLCQRTSIDADTVRIDLEIVDRSGRDRAINVYYVVPVPATGWRWWDNIQQWRSIQPRQQYVNGVRSGVGATGTQSRYPFACISNGRRADALLVTEPR